MQPPVTPAALMALPKALRVTLWHQCSTAALVSLLLLLPQVPAWWPHTRCLALDGGGQCSSTHVHAGPRVCAQQTRTGADNLLA